MNDKLSAAYQLLNNANDSFVQAFKILAQGMEYQKQAFELLKLREVLNAMPTAAPSLSTDIPPAGQGCTVKFALWKGNNLSGSVEVSEQQHTAKYRCVLFNANPNDQGRVFNGSIVPENNQGSLRDNQVGGVFIHVREGGKYTISGYIEASVANNKISFNGELVGNDNVGNPRAPHLRALCMSAERFFTNTASSALGQQSLANTSNTAGNVVQQLTSDNLLGGLVSAPGSPADPILPTQPTSTTMHSPEDFFGGGTVSIEQASETLVDGSENDLRNLLG